MSGTKVTSDPLSKVPNAEKSGEVLSDSLAAESIKSNGGFSQNAGAAISGQSAAGSTTANQDTSGATKLPAAESAAVRSTADSEANTAAENAKSSSVDQGAYGTVAGGNAGSRAAGTAPSYVHSGNAGDGKPAGEGLKEGGFNADAPNASFGTDIGGKNDPGRVATQKFANENATAGSFAEAGRDSKISGDGQFDVLKDAPA